MTKSKNDTKKNFSAENNRFIVSLDGVIKVRCLDCKGHCGGIALPEFTMYFCENPSCGNNMELRYLDKEKKFELHDYGGLFTEPEFQTAVENMMEEQQLLVRPEPVAPAEIIEFPGKKDN